MAGTPIRFAAIADVHGNDLALEALIADIRARFADGSWRATMASQNWRRRWRRGGSGSGVVRHIKTRHTRA
jgi:hypothetical protein